MPATEKDYKSRAKEAERRAKQLDKKYARFLKDSYKKDSRKIDYTEDALRESSRMKIPLAEAYEDAAKNYFAAKNLKKAIKNYTLATREYGDIFQSNFTDPKEIEKFRARCFRGVKILERLRKVKKRKWKGLEGKVTVVAIISILGTLAGIFFLSPNLTGNTIANLTNQTSNIIGGALFVIGIIGSYFWFKKR